MSHQIALDYEVAVSTVFTESAVAVDIVFAGDVFLVVFCVVLLIVEFFH